MSEVKRLKGKVNRILAKNRDLKEELAEAQKKLADEIEQASDKADPMFVEEAARLLRDDGHDHIHHANGCRSCKALLMLEESMDITYSDMNDPERWKRVHGYT